MAGIKIPDFEDLEDFHIWVVCDGEIEPCEMVCAYNIDQAVASILEDRYNRFCSLEGLQDELATHPQGDVFKGRDFCIVWACHASQHHYGDRERNLAKYSFTAKYNSNPYLLEGASYEIRRDPKEAAKYGAKIEEDEDDQ